MIDPESNACYWTNCNVDKTYDEKEQVPLEDVATEDDDEDIPF